MALYERIFQIERGSMSGNSSDASFVASTDDDDDHPRRRRRDDYRARMASRDEVRSIDATTRDAMRDETRTTMRSVGG